MHREISNERGIESKLDTPARHSTLLFGATSILGFNLARMFPQAVLPFVTPGSRAPSLRGWPVLKLEDHAWPETLFERHWPDTLLYCHAVCDVPKCEAAPDWAREINVEHVRRVLAALPSANEACLRFLRSCLRRRRRVRRSIVTLSHQHIRPNSPRRGRTGFSPIRFAGDPHRLADRPIAERTHRPLGLAALSQSSTISLSPSSMMNIVRWFG